MAGAARLLLLTRGGPRIVSGDGRTAALGGASAALLTILALTDKRESQREWVTGLLWPDRDPAVVGRSLTSEIRMVREAVEAAGLGGLAADQGALRLDISADAVDARRFAALAGSDEAEARGQAILLYDADLLEGFIGPSTEFDHWLAQKRAELRNLAISAAGELMDGHLEADRRPEALSAAQRLLALDPGHEAAHRTAMRLLAASGRRAEAVRQFEICQDTLRDEFGLEPEAETLKLFDAIRKSAAENGAGVPEATVAPGATPPASTIRRWGSVVAIALALAGFVYLVALEAGLIGRSLQPADATRIARPIPEVPSVIITGFDHDRGDPELAVLAGYLADAMAENLLAASGLVVIDAREIARLQAEPLSPASAAEAYGVRFFIQGRLSRSADNVKLSVGLIDALAGVHQWDKTYRFAMTEAAGLRERLALEILVELEVELQEGEQARMALIHGTSSLEAWAAASEALRKLRLFSPEENRNARGLYREAMRLDPKYPGAVGGLGWTYFVEAYFGWSDDRAGALHEAGRLGAEALALDPQRPRTLALLGAVTAFVDPQQGLALAGDAVALAPSSAEEKAILGLLESYVGNADRAVELFNQANRLSVRPPDWFDWGLGRALRRAGRLDEAIAILRESVAKAHQANSPRTELVLALAEAGDAVGARSEAQALLRSHPGFSVGDWAAGAPQAPGSGLIDEVALLLAAGLPD